MLLPTDRVLVLDDDPGRLRIFRKKLFVPREVVATQDMQEALRASLRVPFDVMYLDRDLGCDTDVNRKPGGLFFESYSGEDFVEALLAGFALDEKYVALYVTPHRSLLPREVVIHSTNDVGAQAMASKITAFVEEHDVGLRYLRITRHPFNRAEWLEADWSQPPYCGRACDEFSPERGEA